MKIIAIPKYQLDNWKLIPICENGERLVALSTILSKKRLRLDPVYYTQGVQGAISEVYLRESVFSKIEKVIDLLPSNMELVIWDGWRPLATQQSIFDVVKMQISLSKPKLSEEELIKCTSVFVSLPSSDPTKPSPHNTGGSIDLTIAHRNGDLLEMGTSFDEFTKKAQTVFFERSDKDLTATEIRYRENRRLLYSIMTEVGFTNYPEEWWHFDYGNQFWASISGAKNAIYSNIVPSKEN